MPIHSVYLSTVYLVTCLNLERIQMEKGFCKVPVSIQELVQVFLGTVQKIKDAC